MGARFRRDACLRNRLLRGRGGLRANGRTERKLEVRVAGGTLLIEWDEETGHVFMTGPAVTVFEGTVDTEEL